MTEQITAEKLFLSKYGNKITASESWVIRFAEEYAEEKTKELQERLSNALDVITENKLESNKKISDLQSRLDVATKALENGIIVLQVLSDHVDDLTMVDTAENQMKWNKDALEQIKTNTLTP